MCPGGPLSFRRRGRLEPSAEPDYRRTSLLVRHLILVAGAPASPLLPAAAAQVDTTLDLVDENDGLLSLREAILAANATPEADTIVLPEGQFELSLSGVEEDQGLSGDLDVLAPLTLRGAGPKATTIDARGIDRVFEVALGVPVTFEDLTVRGGRASLGAGILASGDVVLRSCIVESNTAESVNDLEPGSAAVASGGGIYARANLAIEDGFVHGNRAMAEAFDATARGGGIYCLGELWMLRTEVAGNLCHASSTAGTASASGGGIGCRSPGVVSVFRSTLVKNRALARVEDVEPESLAESTGGALTVHLSGVESFAHAYVGETLLSDNAAFAQSTGSVARALGGGLAGFAERPASTFWTLDRCEVRDNVATVQSGGSGSSSGGAVFHRVDAAGAETTLAVRDSFFARNEAEAVPLPGDPADLEASGGAVSSESVEQALGVVELKDSAFHHNTARSAGLSLSGSPEIVSVARGGAFRQTLAEDGGTVVSFLEGCRFKGNAVFARASGSSIRARAEGGAIHQASGASDGMLVSLLSDCELRQNTADGRFAGTPGSAESAGGALRAVVETADAVVVLSLTRCELDDDRAVARAFGDSARADAAGGALSLGAANYRGEGTTIVEAADCSFEGNLAEAGAPYKAVASGGAIEREYQADAAVLLRGCKFAWNRALADAETWQAEANGGAIANEALELELRDCELEHNTARAESSSGRLNNADAYGGAIRSLGRVDLLDSTLRSNFATAEGSDPGTRCRGFGGAVFLFNGEARVARCDVRQNRVSASGGGDSFASGGAWFGFTSSHRVERSTLEGNEARAEGTESARATGGAMDLFGDDQRILESTVKSNVARAHVPGADAGHAIGGGIWLRGGLPEESFQVIERSTIWDNAALGGWGSFGGGVSFGDQWLSRDLYLLVNSTLSGNRAASGGGVLGPWASQASALVLINCTLVHNSAEDHGGGLVSEFPFEPAAYLWNTIIAVNTGGDSPDVDGEFTSFGHNVIGDRGPSVGLVDGVLGDQVGSEVAPLHPKLGPLLFNGGPTRTHAVLPGSPALDRGDSSVLLSGDQRSFPRQVDGDADGVAQVDVGAYEAEQP